MVVGFLGGNPFDALVGLPVELDVDPFAVLVDEFEGVAAVAVHVSVPIGNTTVTEEDHDLMDRFWVLAQVVPEHGRVISTAQVSSGVPLLGVDEMWEFGGVS